MSQFMVFFIWKHLFSFETLVIRMTIYSNIKIGAMTYLLMLLTIGVITQVQPANLKESFVAPYGDMLKENMASIQIQRQINSSVTSIIENLDIYNVYIRNLTDELLEEYRSSIHQKVTRFKSDVISVQSRSRSVSGSSSNIFGCLLKESHLDDLAEEVNKQVRKCATVAMAEMVNVVTNSLKEAQTFMSIPRVIGNDIQRCGLSYACRWDIVGDAISESLQVPPKVFALTARIQSLAIRTIVSVDSCGLQGLREITETALSILGTIFNCVSNTTYSKNSNH